MIVTWSSVLFTLPLYPSTVLVSWGRLLASPVSRDLCLSPVALGGRQSSDGARAAAAAALPAAQAADRRAAAGRRRRARHGRRLGCRGAPWVAAADGRGTAGSELFVCAPGCGEIGFDCRFDSEDIEFWRPPARCRYVRSARARHVASGSNSRRRLSVIGAGRETKHGRNKATDAVLGLRTTVSARALGAQENRSAAGWRETWMLTGLLLWRG